MNDIPAGPPGVVRNNFQLARMRELEKKPSPGVVRDMLNGIDLGDQSGHQRGDGASFELDGFGSLLLAPAFPVFKSEADVMVWQRVLKGGEELLRPYVFQIYTAFHSRDRITYPPELLGRQIDAILDLPDNEFPAKGTILWHGGYGVISIWRCLDDPDQPSKYWRTKHRFLRTVLPAVEVSEAKIWNADLFELFTLISTDECHNSDPDIVERLKKLVVASPYCREHGLTL